MGYAKYVGRVGALAVALGIGTAVANPAWADTRATDTESTSRTTEPATSQPTSGGVDESVTPSGADNAATETDTEPEVEEAEAEAEELEEAVQDALDEELEIDEDIVVEEIDIAEEASEEGVEPTPPAVDDSLTDRSDNSDSTEPVLHTTAVVDSEPTPPADEPEPEPEPAELASESAARLSRSTSDADTTHSASTLALTTAAPADVPAPAPLVQQPKTPIGLILGGPAALLDIAAKAIDMLFNPGPSVPGDPPLLLGVLAFVRREIQRSFFNSTPDAVADVATTSEGVPTRITVLGNDTDPNVGDILTVTNYTQAANGLVALNPDGSFTYTPKAGFSGTDTFTYTASDDASAWHVHGLVSLLSGHDSTATVTITVAPINDAPNAVNDATTVNEDSGPTKIAALANDSDAEGNSLVIASVGTADKGGAVAINPDGTISYTPTANFNGVDFFTYTISDGTQTATAMVTVTVAPINDAPTAVSDAATVAGGSGTNINVLANDTDPDVDDTLTVTATGAPDHGGSVTVNADTTIAYKPAAGFSGTETFTYTITDGTATAVGTVTVTVTPVAPVNVAPVAGNDTFTMPVGATSSTISVLANDTDADGDPLTVVGVTGAVSGTTTFSSGSITYTPTPGFAGTEVLTYTVSDGALTDTATLTITVLAVPPINAAPVAGNDTFTMPVGATSSTIGVLGNDTDPDGDTLSVVAVTGAVSGTTTFTGTSVIYTPTPGFAGMEVLTYTISDGDKTDTATLTITVPPVPPINAAPVAGNDTFTMPVGATSSTISVLANDTDADGDPLTVVGVTGVANGTATYTGGTITYTPTTGFAGTETLTYTVSDGALTDTATLTITVPAVPPANVAPVAGNDTFTMPVGAVNSTISVLGNDTDADGDPLTVVAVTGASNGTTTFSGGSITYTPTAGFAGVEVLTYTVSDGALTDTATLTITVPAVPPANVAPVAGNDSFTMPVGAVNSTISVLGNDTDADGDPLTVVAVTGASNGTTTFSGGQITYTPTSGFAGTEVLTYTVSDGALTDTATLTITVPAVPPVNVAPVAGNDTFTMPVGAVNSTISVLGNDTDADGDPLTVVAVTGAANGTTTFTGGQITYTPTPGFAGTEVLTYTVSDGALTDTATLTITVPAVPPVNHAPVAGEPAYEYTTHVGSGIISGTLDVTDEDGDDLTFTVSDLPDDEVGTLAIDPETGAWQFKPTNQARFDAWRNPGEVVATISITVSDGQASVTVDVEASIAPAFYFDYHWTGTEVEDAKSVVVLSSDGRLFADNADGLTVINPDGSIDEPILLGFRPTDAAFGTDGRLYLTDPVTDSISVLDLEIGSVSRFASAPNASGLAFDSEGRLFVASPEARTITIIDPDGTTTDIIEIDAIPTDVAVGSDGKIYVAEIADDRNSVRLTVRNADGSVAAVLYDRISSPLGDYAAPLGLAVGANGAIFLVDSNRGELTAFTSDGQTMDTAWVDGMTRGIAVSADGQLVVLSALDNSVVLLTPAAQDWDEEYDYTVDSETNVVTGEVYVLNPGGHLTFALTEGPPSALGTVTVDEATGAWLFVPTAEAIAAAAYGEYDWSNEYVSDVDFVITISDGTQISVNAPIFGDPEYGVDVIENVGGTPTALTVGTDGRIYVANRDSKTITVLDASGNVVDTIELDFEPVGITTAWQVGYIVVTNGVDNTLTAISASGEIESLPLTAHTEAIDIIAIGDGGFDHDNELRFYIAGDNSVSVYDAGFESEFILDVSNPTGIALGTDGEIYVVGTEVDGAGYLKVYDYDGNLVTTTLLGGRPSGIALGPNNHLYISDRNGLPRDVAIADMYGWVSQTLELGVNGGAVTVAPDGRVYVANPNTGAITVLTPPNAPPVQTPVGSVDTIETSGVTSLYGIAVAPDGRIIVTGYDAFYEFVLGTVEDDGSVTTLMNLDGTAAGVEVGPDGRIYVADFDQGRVTAYDPANGFASELIATVPGAIGLAFDAAGNLYVTSNNLSNNGLPTAGSLLIIAPDGGTETVALPGLSYDVQVASDGRVFVTYLTLPTDTFTPTGGGILILDANGTTANLDLPPGINPAGVAISPDGTVFIANFPVNPASGGGKLVVRYPNGITRAIAVGEQPFGLDFDTEGRLLITDASSNTITVLDPIYDPVNEHAPTVQDDPESHFTSGSGVVSGAVIGADLDGDLLTYSVVAEVDLAVGAVVTDPLSGVWQFTPTVQAQLDAWESRNNDPDAEESSVTFSIEVTDGLASDAVSITVNIVPGTQPTAQDPAFTIVETNPSSGLVSGQINVVDADGDILIYQLASSNANLHVYLRYDTGDWEFWPSSELREAASTTPGADTYTFVVNVTDGATTVPVTVTVPVLPYTAPQAADPAFTITSTTASTGRVEGVLNVTDADEDPLTYVVSGDVEAADGWVSVDYYTGNWSFTPTEAARDAAYDSAGEDSVTFLITVSDGRTSSVVLTVTAPVMPDLPPQVGNPAYTITSTAGGVVNGQLNVTDAEGGLTYQLTTAPDSLLGYVNHSYWNNTWSFTPSDQARLDAADTAEDDFATFVMTVSDGRHTVDVTVEAPILPDLVAPQPESPAFSITSTGADGRVYGEVHVTDPDSSNLTYEVTIAPDSAVGYVNYSYWDGNWTFTPTAQARLDAADTAGEDTVTFVITASDGTRTTDITVEAPIVPNLAAPQAGSPAFSVTSTSNGRVYGTVNVTDADGDALTYYVSTQPDSALGSVYQNYYDGGWTFTPTLQARLDAAASAGVDIVSFVITASDGVRTVDVPVTADIIPETVPEAGTPPFAVNATDSTSGVVTGTVNVIDGDGDPLTYSVSNGGDSSVGTVDVDYYSGAWTFTPTAQARYNAWADAAAASAAFSIRASDSWATTDVTVVVDILPGLDSTILQQLAANGDVLVSEDEDGTVRAIHGAFVPRIIATKADAAEVLNVIASVLSATPGFASENSMTVQRIVGLDGAPTEVFYRLKPTIDGVQMPGSTVTLVTDTDGAVTAAFSSLSATLQNVDTTPTITQEAAKATAAAALRALILDQNEDGVDGTELDGFISKLKIEAELSIESIGPESSPSLVWRVTAQTAPAASNSDSTDPGGPRTGALFAALYQIAANGPSAGVIVAETLGVEAALPTKTVKAADLHDILQEINVAPFPSTTYLWDTDRNITTYRIYSGTGWKQVDIFYSDVIYDGSWPKDAVSAHGNMAKTYDYFLYKLGHRSIDNDSDGDGKFKAIEIYLDYRGGWGEDEDEGDRVDYLDNGYYFGSSKTTGYILFGNSGDNEGALDFVAHEFTHGVINHTAGFEKDFANGNQAGALNEAYADILGNLVEAQVKSLSRTDPTRWLIFEDANGDPSRDLQNPSRFPSGTAGNYRHDYEERFKVDTISEANDWGGVHANSTIFSHAFYRMVTDPSEGSWRGSGRTNNITDEKWARVFYNSLYRLSSKATFVDARSAVISSAKVQGFTDDEIKAIQDAFDHVGIHATNYKYGSYESIDLGPAPYDLAFGAEGGRAYVTLQNGMIKIIDTEALSSSGSAGYTPITINLGGTPGGIAVAADGWLALATNPSANEVAVIDTKVIETVPVNNPGAIAVSSNGLIAYITNTQRNAMTVVDLTTGINPATVEIPLCAGCDYHGDVTLNADGNLGFITHPGANTVSVIRYNGVGEVPEVRTVSITSPHSVASSADGSVAVVYSSTGRVTVIDASGSEPVAAEVPGYFSSYTSTGFVALSADGKRAFVTNHSGSSSVVAIDTSDPSDPQILWRKSLTDLPHSVATTSAGSRAYVVAHDHFWVLDTRSGIVKAIPANMPSAITYNSASDYQQVAVRGNGNVVIATSVNGDFVVLNGSAF